LRPRDRLRRIFEGCPDGLDAVVLANGTQPDPNFFYVSGYRSGLFEGNALFLFRDLHVEVLTNPLEEQAARARKDFTVHVLRGRDRSDRRRLVASLLKGCKRVGLNFGGLSHAAYLELEEALGPGRIADASEALAKARMVKDPDEIELISEAAKAISKVVDRVPRIAKEGMTERELKAKVDYLIVDEGADSPSFESIVAFGENSALPHYSAGERRLRRGDNVLVDAGARYRLYCSDITRTFFCGRAAAWQREAYEKVLEAQKKAIAGIRAGVEGRSVHDIAAKVIERSKFRGKFIHGLGHSLGLEVHDGPGFSPGNRAKIGQNMVITVEPGVYLPGVGGVRIEDDVVVTKTSCRLLTSASNDLIEI
jgi:Xaa-Pro aminopeptidase